MQAKNVGPAGSAYHGNGGRLISGLSGNLCKFPYLMGRGGTGGFHLQPAYLFFIV